MSLRSDMKKLIVKEITCTATCRVMADLYIYQNTYCEANQLYIYIYMKKMYCAENMHY